MFSSLLISKENDEKLKMMFQVFTYSSDLENAYKVTNKALEKYPTSLYWHGKAAETLEWLGKRPEAMKHYMFVYSRTKDKKLENTILEYGLNAYQYNMVVPIVKNKALSNPTFENIDQMIEIYDKVGYPEKAAAILEKLLEKEPTNAYWLKKALSLYIDLGEEEAIQRIISSIEKNEYIDRDTVKQLSEYYMSINNIDKSYEVLLRVDPRTLDSNSTQYYRKVSDLGWYVNKDKSAAEASKQLFLSNNANLQDYERIIYYFGSKEPQLVENVALDAYKKFNNHYLYITYLNTLYKQKKYKKLSQSFHRIKGTELGKDIESNVYFWLMKGQMYSQLNQHEQAIDSLMQALILEPDSTSILSSILWFFIDKKDVANLRKIIFETEERNQIDSALWLPLAAGHYMLQRSDRAKWYINGLIGIGKNDVNIKFMYAYIMQSRGETDAFMKTLREIYTTLNSEKIKNPILMKDKVFLDHYLKSGMFFIAVDKFELLLKKSEKVLDKKEYIELSIFWALRHNREEMARHFSRKLKKIEPWMKLNIALAEDDRGNMNDLLDKYFHVLPIRDRVVAAIRTGNLALAQTLAFDGLENNKYDYLLYNQMRSLIESSVDTMNLKLGYLNRGNITQKYFTFSNKYYLAKGWSLLSNVLFSRNRNKDKRNLKNIPKNDISVDIGMKKNFDSGYVDFYAGVRSSLETYYSFSIFGHYEPMSKVILEAFYGDSIKADETTYLLLGGKKNELKLKASLQYLPSTNISLSIGYHKFYGQDNKYLGDAYKGRIEVYQQIRSGYPDIAWGVFSELSEYYENNNSNTAINSLQTFNAAVLPESFYTAGFNFFYGVINKEQYTRVWRPYFEFSPYYNSFNSQINFSTSGGYGGSIYDKDHLTFGFNYDQAVNGTLESSFNLFIRYHVLY